MSQKIRIPKHSRIQFDLAPKELVIFISEAGGIMLKKTKYGTRIQGYEPGEKFLIDGQFNVDSKNIHPDRVLFSGMSEKNLSNAEKEMLFGIWRSSCILFGIDEMSSVEWYLNRDKLRVARSLARKGFCVVEYSTETNIDHEEGELLRLTPAGVLWLLVKSPDSSWDTKIREETNTEEKLDLFLKAGNDGSKTWRERKARPRTVGLTE